MTKRRAKFKRHSGKMIKLFKDLFFILINDSSTQPPRATKTTSKMFFNMRLLLLLAIIISLLGNNMLINTSQALQLRVQASNSASVKLKRPMNDETSAGSQLAVSAARSGRGSLDNNNNNNNGDDQADPMEPCYLANNRASETLTISESTPVGTIVGELLVNGDSSQNGNIELSIKMPVSSGQTALSSHHHHHQQHYHSGTSASAAILPIVDNRHTIGTQRQKQTDDYYSTSSTSEGLLMNRRIGSSTLASASASSPTQLFRDKATDLGSQSSSMKSQQQQQFPLDGRANYYGGARITTGPKNARDLSNLIDLMPPLSIDQGTKRLILAKKLDRENLDKYIQAGSYQSSYSSINSLSQVSSASLTVHIKCQLRDRSVASNGGDSNYSDQRHESSHGTGTNSLHSLSASVGNSNATAISSTMATVATSSGEIGKNSSVSARAATKPQLMKNSNTNSILIPIHLIVTDENDNWPNFIGSPYIIDLNESAPVGSLLQGNEIVAVDNDQQGPLSTIEYSIVAGSLWSDTFAFLNPLDARSLIVKDNRLIDYESQSKLTLKVMARDQGDPPNWAITSLYVNLLDQDDLNPVFSEDKYSGYVKDNRPGEVIDLLPKRMIAHDGDKNLNSPVIYSFHMKTNHSIHFDLDPDLGHLTLKKTLTDDETLLSRHSFCLLISARQVDNPQRSTLTAINLQMATPVLSALETLPTSNEKANLSSYLSGSGGDGQHILKFAQSSYTVEISETAQVGSTVFTARAGQNNGIVYQLLDNELGYLRIDQVSGKLTLNKSLDFEMYRHLSVRVLATSESIDESNSPMQSTTNIAYPKLACDITRVNINIIDHNDFTPEFSHEQYNFQLSVSDLIANYEPAKGYLEDGDESTTNIDGIQLSSHSEPSSFKFGRRLGDHHPELDNSQVDNDLDYKALQLGQVHCADRDFNDKITLSLNGSKANLFQLTQDGRLYLPLVNISNLSSPNQLSRFGDIGGASSLWGPRGSQKTINNKFMQMSRAFSATTRRSDTPGQPDQLDRKYLNYLLGEFSNLGRLRLKVHAVDDGQPEQKQSTALIIITIISIDNFIIQRAHQTAQASSSNDPLESGSLVHLTNSTSYQTSKSLDSGQQGEVKYTNQVMMIPSTNGRSFVQINSDIIGNLLSNTKNHDNASSAKNSRSDQTKLHLLDSLDSSASNTLSRSINFNAPDSPGQMTSAQSAQATSGNRFQPPGLLLVDDEGAKFVAMPAAIEVYNQQVQEAADKQTRQRSQHDSRDKLVTLRQSIWHQWGNKLGLGTTDNGPVYWINLSSALILHLIVVALVVSLVSKFRSSFRGDDDSFGRHNSDSQSFQNSSNLWLRPSLSMLGSFFRTKSRQQHDPDTSILNNHATSTYGNVASALSPSEAPNQYSNFMRQQQQQQQQQYARDNGIASGSLSECAQDESNQRQSIVSSGIVVSAVSNKHKPPNSTIDNDKHDNHKSPLQQQQQQNLFHHLKLTLNKMMDADQQDSRHIEGCTVGQVSVRPLESDVIAYEDLRDSQLDACAQYRETTELQIHQTKKCFEEKSAISTFVGNNTSNNNTLHNQRSNLVPNQNENSPRAGAAVVSISIRGSSTTDDDCNKVVARSSASPQSANCINKRSNLTNNAANSSSNSSVISLVSMTSTLSNKISEAVGRAGGDRVTSSDSSSLNSSILLNGCGSSNSSSNDCNAPRSVNKSSRTPPAPPPLPPPPPSRVQVTNIMDHNSRKQASPSQSPARRGALSGEKFTDKLSRNVMETAAAEGPLLNSRQSQPENPVHVRLIRQAMSDQVALASGSSGKSTVATDKSNLAIAGRRSNESRAQKQVDGGSQRVQQSSSIVGRREARQYNSMQEAALPPTPPPMPMIINNGQRHICGSNNLLLVTTNKTTVSPTTSVDRGYESFQSCTSMHGPSYKSKQFNSLPECEMTSNANTGDYHDDRNPANYALSSLPNYSKGTGSSRTPAAAAAQANHIESRRPQANSLMDKQNSVQLVQTFRSPNRSSACRSAANADQVQANGRTRSSSNVSNRIECDTEDDDFFYCCNESAHSSDVHQLSVGSLLTEYANHTYKQPNSQIGNKQQRVKSSRHQQHQHKSTAAPISSRRRASSSSSRTIEHYNNARNDSLNVTINLNNPQDLITYCDQQQQQQHQEQQQQQNYNQICDTVHHHKTSARIQGTVRQQKLRLVATNQSSQHQPQYYNQASNGGGGGGGGYLMKHNGAGGANGSNKKQLTWSDQVE